MEPNGEGEPSGSGEIDRVALGRYLETHIEGFHDLRALVKFDTGQSNPTFRLEAASGLYVLRAKPPGALLKSAHQVDREFRVMTALAGRGVPVPRMLHLAEEARSPLGRMFFVMEHVQGRIFWDPALPELDAKADRAAIYDAMNAALAALHAVDVEAASLTDYGRPGDYFARQLARWSDQYRHSEIEPIADMNRLIAWLERRLPPEDRTANLVHGDYRLDNMIFAADATRLAAVLDWELSTLGHPLSDLAYQCMQWRLPNVGAFRGLGGVDRTALGIPSEDAYVARYCERRGIGGIDNWTFYLAFSFFRLAAILQGVFKRFVDGNASNPVKAKLYGRTVPVLAALAMDLVTEGAE